VRDSARRGGNERREIETNAPRRNVGGVDDLCGRGLHLHHLRPDSAFSRVRGGIAASTSRSRAAKKASRRIRYGTTAAEERERKRERIAGRCALQREILEFASRALRGSFFALLEYARGKREGERGEIGAVVRG